jgi:hypothetical protein
VESILSELLQSIAESSDYPDLRDRAFFYWRILREGESDLPMNLVFTEMPAIKYEEQIKHSKKHWESLLKNIGKLSGAMLKKSDKIFGDKKDFIKRGELEVDSETFNMPAVGENGSIAENQSESKDDASRKVSDIFAMDDAPPVKATTAAPLPGITKKEAKVMEVDLLDMDFANENAHIDSTNTGQATNNAGGANDLDILNDFDNQFMVSTGNAGTNPAKPTNSEPDEDLFGDDDEDIIGGGDEWPSAKIEFKVLREETLVKKDVKGKSGKSGLVVKGRFVVEGASFDVYLVLTIKNKSGVEVSGLTLQFKPNYFGFKVGKPNQTSIRNFFYSKHY